MIPAIALDQVVAAAHDVAINEVANSLAKAALFGIKVRKTVGLRLTLYGGVFPTVAGPVIIPEKEINLTASTTNYIYVDTAGAIFKVTSAPAGWPGPMATGYRALYQLTVGANAITSGTSYVLGPSSPGPNGPQGATGPAGNELWLQRKRIAMEVGGGATNLTLFGFDITSGGQVARGFDTSFFTGCIASAFYGDAYSQPFCYLGNAAGRGGFDVLLRWAFESSAGLTARRFFGLADTGSGAFSNVEPDTFVNIIGVAAKSTDANLSVMHNDSSGTATTIALGANFPARTTTKTYELRLVSVANSGTVTYTMTEVEGGNVATGVISTNLPANTLFLGWYAWSLNGTGAGFRFMQTIANTRY